MSNTTHTTNATIITEHHKVLVKVASFIIKYAMIILPS